MPTCLWASVKTLENENEFFSARFLCKYTFMHFAYIPKEVLFEDSYQAALLA
ncbi:hypothetical protein P3T25_006154 [Paraburkholderia sp. GAS32]